MLELIKISPLPVEKIDPAGPFAGPLDTKYTTVAVDGRDVRIGETMDFSRADPWSQLAMRAVRTLHDEGAFKGDITILEAGVGDGRNLLQAIGIGQSGGSVDPEWTGRLVGIDIDPRRVALSRANFAALGLASRTNFLEGDAVRRMQDYSALVRGGEAAKLSGVAIACLPQAPLDAETLSSADGFDPRLPSFRRVRDLALRGRSVADYGLTLNAAFLVELRDCVDDGALQLLIVVSDRVPRAVVRELFERTGWEEVRSFVTPTPVRQDPDTSVQYVVDGRFESDGLEGHTSFYQRTADGGFAPLRAEEAERRRREFMLGGGAGELDVHHHVFAYLVRPLAPAPLNN